MDEKNTEEIVEDGILRPTIPAEQLIEQNKVNNANVFKTRIEQYNHNNGIKDQQVMPVKSGITMSKSEDVNTNTTKKKKIVIKAPKSKKNNILLFGVLGAIIVVGCLIAFLPKSTPSAPTTSAPVVDNESEKEETKPDLTPSFEQTVCSLKLEYPSFGYNRETTYTFYSVDGKLKNYEINMTMEYSNEVSDAIILNCSQIEEKYKKYDGYTYLCRNDNNKISYITTVDLEVLENKELLFGYEKRIINENLDDDIENYIEKYTNDNYTCNKN